MDQKYYWCVYAGKDSRGIGACNEITLDEHPFKYFKKKNKERNKFWTAELIIINYKEISREEYDLWNQQ